MADMDLGLDLDLGLEGEGEEKLDTISGKIIR